MTYSSFTILIFHLEDNLLVIGGMWSYNGIRDLSDVEVLRVQANHDRCDPPDFEFSIEFHSSIATSSGVVTCGGLAQRNPTWLSNCTIVNKEGQEKSFPSMVRPRKSFTLSQNKNRMYAVGGINFGMSNTMEILNLGSKSIHNDHWVEKKLPYNFTSPCVVSIEHSIYLIDGLRGDTPTLILNMLDYTWTTGPSMNEKRSFFSCFYDKQSNSIYVIGGAGLATTEKWNLKNNIWEPSTNLNEPLYNSAAVASKSEEYIGFVSGGTTKIKDRSTNNVWGLRRSDEKWIKIKQGLKTPRSYHTMVNVDSEEIPGC